LVKDGGVDDLLFPAAFDLINNKEQCEFLAKNCKMLAKPEATNTIVDEVEKLVK
jgi:UDP-N-acetylglucosamine--N-acetylmuramyl-(pentapeptide) pyrophosphoryl-undecaprenol N-acetylglucosamine transferase